MRERKSLDHRIGDLGTVSLQRDAAAGMISNTAARQATLSVAGRAVEIFGRSFPNVNRASDTLEETRFADTHVDHDNHRRDHESLENLMPADVFFGRGRSILQQRDKIKRKTIETRRLLHRKSAA